MFARRALHSAILALLPLAPPAGAMTLAEAYALKGDSKLALELRLNAAGAPRGGATVSAVAAPGRGQALLAALTQLGLDLGAAAGDLVTGVLPYHAVPKLDGLKDLRPVRLSPATFHICDSTCSGTSLPPPPPPGTFGPQGAYVSEADQQMFAAPARSRFGVDGTGVTVGVLSDSYNCTPPPDPYTYIGNYAEIGVFMSDLPADVQVLKDPCKPAPVGSGMVVNVDNSEGLWMLQDEGALLLALVHDLAPGARLAFHTAIGGQAALAAGIRALADAGATVITDDIVYLDEPVYQDGGPVADAVREAVARGVTYVAAAGNFGRHSYEAPFRPSGTTVTIPAQSKTIATGCDANDPRRSGCSNKTTVTTPARTVQLHDFDPGPGVDTCQKITVFYNIPQPIALALHWDQPYASIGPGPGATSDLDLFLMDASCQEVVQSLNFNGLDPSAWGLSHTASSLFGVAATDNLQGDPVETLTVSLPGSDCRDYNNPSNCQRTYGIAVGLAAGPPPSRLRITYGTPELYNGYYPFSAPLQESDGPAYWNLVTHTDADTPGLFGHPNLAEAVAVGAVRGARIIPYKARYSLSPLPPSLDHRTELFSALGGTPVLFDGHGAPLPAPLVRQKPDVAGLDCTIAIGPLATAPSQVQNAPGALHCGTSFAAAHVAGLIALAKQAAPAAGPAQIAAALRASAVDLDDTLTPNLDVGYDPGTGYGLADGENLIATLLAQPATPRLDVYSSIAALTTAGNGGSGGNGGDSKAGSAPAPLCAHPTATVAANGRYRGTPKPDVVEGGPGNDRLDGGPGNDLLIGGGGADTFRFVAPSGTDKIADLGPRDAIELVGVADANGDGRVDTQDLRVEKWPGATLIAPLTKGTDYWQILVRGAPVRRVAAALRFPQ